jgi:hypothetical protein
MAHFNRERIRDTGTDEQFQKNTCEELDFPQKLSIII